MLKFPKAPILNFITDSTLDFETNYRLIELGIQHGVNLVQYRRKTGSAQSFLIEATRLQALCKTYAVPFIINDHLSLAVELNADGLHIGQDDQNHLLARAQLGSDKIIGLSLNTLEQAKICGEFDVDYFGVGPVFPTPNKPEQMAIGLEELRSIVAILNKPSIAIGGIDLETLVLLPRELAGIAVISALSQAENPTAATQNLKEKLCEHILAV